MSNAINYVKNRPKLTSWCTGHQAFLSRHLFSKKNNGGREGLQKYCRICKTLTSRKTCRVRLRDLSAFYEANPNYRMDCGKWRRIESPIKELLPPKGSGNWYSDCCKAVAVKSWTAANKHCQSCGLKLPIEIKDNKFCSSSCAASFNNKLRGRVEKNCLQCNSLIKSRKAKFCSLRCQADHYYKKTVTLWLEGKISGTNFGGLNVKNFVRKWLIEQRGEACWGCGWNKKNPTTNRVPIQVHHKDGDGQKTVPDNLELLCPNCHSLTPTFGGLNRGRGRAYRRRTSVEDPLFGKQVT